MEAPPPYNLLSNFCHPCPCALLAPLGRDDLAAALPACVVRGSFVLFAVSLSTPFGVAFRCSKWIEAFGFAFALEHFFFVFDVSCVSYFTL
ncbi:hypothetical protein B0H11DRAFT_1149044 [Mycena galericulata]|nr:hypothetical protein B0H11DRAFT_1149044 [Mycena galericulata]